MSAKNRIMQRLRERTHSDRSSIQAGTFPARKITRNVVGEFVAQAELSGAKVVQLNSEELKHKTNRYLNDGATVVNAALAIAETGSVALRSIDAPSADSYLCDHLVVCVARDRIVALLHEGLAELTTDATRALHLITGPSRTADVEQTIQIGAHGPRQLTIALYGSGEVC